MKLNYGLTNSAYRHVKYEKVSSKIWNNNTIDLNLVKGEKFAFQLLVKTNKNSFFTLDRKEVGWQGVNQNIIRIENHWSEKSKLNIPNNFFVGYVADDNGKIIADSILNKTGQEIEANIPQAIWIEGKVPKDYSDKKELKLIIKILEQNNYDDENLIDKIEVKINIKDIVLPNLKDSKFHLDLWQHPSNWARMYEISLWSEEHWEIIKSHLKELASMGQNAITVIGSDMPWAGQECYKISNYPSNLFEYNMVKVKKNKEGKLVCDFENLDKYINLCFDLGINQEIELFGLLGVWDKGYGNPLEDYSDAIRVKYYDENENKYKYIHSKELLKNYIKQLIKHLKKQNWWDMTRIASDEPDNTSKFKSWLEFIKSIEPDIKIKAAIQHNKFIEKLNNDIYDWVFHLPTVINNFEDIENMKNKDPNKFGNLIWYVCCSPDKPNNFLKSPLLENRLMGWITYYLKLDGFLRWDYAIWPKTPWEKPGYNYPIFSAGDMFFIYPGKNAKPIRSLRWENLRFGIQDFLLINNLEKNKLDYKEIKKMFLNDLLGDFSNINSTFENVEWDYSDDYNKLMTIRNNITKRL